MTPARCPRLATVIRRSITLSAACLSALALGACASAPRAGPAPEALRWEAHASGTTESLRALSVVSAKVAWASGAHGTFLRTVDGVNWQAGRVSGAEQLDFRDVQAFDAERAVLISAGTPSRIYRTLDGGKQWTLVSEDRRPGAFFDAMAFWDDRVGLAVGDPLQGRFVVLRTDDGGATWTEVSSPAALPGEGAFAASGTCLTVQGSSDAWFGSGGPVARVFHSSDGGLTWNVSETPLVHGNPSSGVFSLAFRDAAHGVAIGGDYKQPTARLPGFASTSDGGATWKLGGQPSGYRSAVAYATTEDSATLVAVGSSGSEYSLDGGATWTLFDEGPFNAVAFASGVGWAVGPDGRLSRLSGVLSDRHRPTR